MICMRCPRNVLKRLLTGPEGGCATPEFGCYFTRSRSACNFSCKINVGVEPLDFVGFWETWDAFVKLELGNLAHSWNLNERLFY